MSETFAILDYLERTRPSPALLPRVDQPAPVESTTRPGLTVEVLAGGGWSVA